MHLNIDDVIKSIPAVWNLIIFEREDYFQWRIQNFVVRANKNMCGSGYNKIKNRVGTNVGRDFILFYIFFFTLILWERHCDFNSA